MSRFWRPLGRKLRLPLALAGLVVLLLLVGAGSAFAASSSSGSNVTWRNEGFSTAKEWTTGEIGPYSEGSLVPFRLTVTNQSNSKSTVVGGFSLQVTRLAHGVAVFDYTTDWAGPLAPSSQDGVADDMLRTTFPAGLALAPGESATFTFMGHLAKTTASQPAAGMLNGNGVCGFSEVEADGVGSFGKRVPVKVSDRAGLLGTPAIAIVESSDAPTSGVLSGTMVNFLYTVTNVGDVPLFNALVSDARFGTIGVIPGPLGPGESASIPAKNVVTDTLADSVTVLATDEIGRQAIDTDEFTVSVFASARVFGSVFNDLDANGAWDAGEPGISGWPVQLSDGLGNSLAIAITSGDGSYSFSDLVPGREYVVTSGGQSLWMETAPIEGRFVITPTSGQDAGPFVFGEYPSALE